MKENIMLWVLGLLVTMILGSYGYATHIGGEAQATAERIEDRMVERLNVIDNKIDRLIERGRN